MKRILAAALVFCLTFSAIQAADSTEAQKRFKLSFTERLRLVTWDNAITLAEAVRGGNTFTRHRTSLMNQYYPHPRMELAVKLTNEFRYYFVPEIGGADLDEVIIDQLYFKWTNPLKVPGALTLGRQNIMLGEGFVVFDGNPLDGSRAAYFNAARFDLDLKPDHRLSLFYAYQEKRDELLPVIHDQEILLIERDETMLGAYYTGKASDMDIDAYVIRKTLDANNLPNVTIGHRLRRPISGEGLTITAEAAFQFGKGWVWRPEVLAILDTPFLDTAYAQEEADRTAFGGHAYLTFQTGMFGVWPRTLTLGGVYLSGDDVNTTDCEAWEPVFARWPKWSESFIYTQLREDGVAYWTNYWSIWGRMDFDLGHDAKLAVDYHRIMAPKDAPEGSGSARLQTGSTRGDLLIGKLTYRISPRLTGHILWEGFWPGDYYLGPNDWLFSPGPDPYGWFRIEYLFKL